MFCCFVWLYLFCLLWYFVDCTVLPRCWFGLCLVWADLFVARIVFDFVFAGVLRYLFVCCLDLRAWCVVIFLVCCYLAHVLCLSSC